MDLPLPQFSPQLLTALQQSRNIVVFSGAGISAESGVATFRTPQEGLWYQVDPEKVGSIGACRRQPATVWGWMAWRRAQILAAQPNPAHLAIARLAQRVESLQVITQNEDDLHERAGSQSVIHLHGEILRPRCFGCHRDYQGAIHEASIILAACRT